MFALVIAYEWLLRAHVSQAPVDLLRYTIDRWDPVRAPVIVGLVALNATVVGAAILIFRLAWSPWTFPERRHWWRLRGAALWLAPASILLFPGTLQEIAPRLPARTFARYADRQRSPRR